MAVTLATDPSARLGVAAGPGADPLTTELVAAVLDAADSLGLASERLGPADDQGSVATLLGLGYPLGLERFFDTPRRCRRVVWFAEPLPPLRDVGRRTTAARSHLFEAGRRAVGLLPRGAVRRTLGRLGGRVADYERWHYLDAAVHLARSSDAFVVTSRDRAAILAARGIPAEVVPFGYSTRQHGPLRPGGDRDVGALVLGGYSGPRSHRRRRWIERWRDDGLNVELAEGVWGDERNALIRRTRVVVEAHRFPGTFIGLRLVIALAGGAAVVSETMPDPAPFIPGVHFVEAPPERLAQETAELLADEPRRRRIVEAGQALLAGELTMTRSLARVLDALDRAPRPSV